MNDRAELGWLLRPDAVVEPLIADWYASTHLISPVTCALNVARRHLPIMESYVRAPASHRAAVATPSLRGGPFLDCEGDRSADIQALIEQTKREQAPLLDLAAAIAECWRLLAERADGHGLAAIYAALPASVRGLVELVYTPAGAPDLRPIEALLYRSRFADQSTQSARLIRASASKRGFILGTPRLDEPRSIRLRRPFTDPVYDVLGRLRTQPRPLAEIAAALAIGGGQLTALEALLQPASARSPRRSRPAPQTSRWRYFGHACVLVESPGGVSVLLDPLVTCEDGDDPPRYTMADLPEHIDYAVITHNHQDHVVLETLLALRWKIGKVLVPRGGGSLVDPSLALALRAIGFSEVIELGPLETYEDRDVCITALPFLGEHADLDVRTKAAWLVDAAGFRCLFAADSNNITPELYDRLAPHVTPLDLLFIGLECQGAPMSWLYGCLLPGPIVPSHDRSRRLDASNSERALALIRALGVRAVRIYAMGGEPWLGFISSIDTSPDTIPRRNADALIAACRAEGIDIELLYGAGEGEAGLSDIVELVF